MRLFLQSSHRYRRTTHKPSRPYLRKKGLSLKIINDDDDDNPSSINTNTNPHNININADDTNNWSKMKTMPPQKEETFQLEIALLALLTVLLLALFLLAIFLSVRHRRWLSSTTSTTPRRRHSHRRRRRDSSNSTKLGEIDGSNNTSSSSSDDDEAGGWVVVRWLQGLGRGASSAVIGGASTLRVGLLHSLPPPGDEDVEFGYGGGGGDERVVVGGQVDGVGVEAGRESMAWSSQGYSAAGFGTGGWCRMRRRGSLRVVSDAETGVVAGGVGGI
ncbi:hypothetical protein C8A00DRAFT_31233 [Chaetomidium leptoderma]|uniref:Uncharacterized protein n=1 Tax=Chaetomidium leptoderma TaxID=669021 RepID=A0AAN6VQF5_9PEZI|nr:hypothetical protein C8A00DRAFT_31233 [Chaetomidium leptoderma]